MHIRRVAALLAAAVVISACTSGGTSPSAGSGSAAAGGCVVGVSWNNFQQPRWAATDKPKMKQTIEAGGGTFIDADANLDNQRQLSDVDTLISKGAKVLVAR